MKEYLSNELVVLGQTPQAVGNFNFKSKFSKIKPGTINIVQPTSLEGTKGNLRISETGEEFKTLRMAFLLEPKEQRQFHIGEGEMKRKLENLMCFTREVVRDERDLRIELQGPDLKAKVPQAQRCQGCPNADWSAYRKTPHKSNIPPCDLYVYAVLIDVNAPRVPLQVYIRSKSKAPFEKAMSEVTRKLLAKFDKDGLPPNYYDVTFTLGTKAIQSNGKTSYIYDFSEFEVSTIEQSELFGDVFEQLAASRDNGDAPESEQTKVAATQTSIDELVTEGITDAEYVDEPITI